MDRRIDLTIGLAVVLLGLAVLYIASGIRATGPVVDPIGPRAFPYMIGAFFVLGGVWVTATRLTGWRGETGNLIETDGEPDEPGVPASALQSFAVMLACVVYAFLLPRLGYAIATPLFAIAGLKAMRMRSWLTIVALALVYTAATFLIFDTYLRVELPLGPLAEAFRALGIAR